MTVEKKMDGDTLTLSLSGRLDTTPLITHTFDIKNIARAYDLFESRSGGVIKTAITFG